MSKRILMVSPTPTHPVNSGNRARICAVISALRQLGHSVHLLHIERERGDHQAMKDAWGDDYHFHPYRMPRPLGPRLLRRLQGWLGLDARYQYALDEWWDDTAEDTIRGLHRKFNFDVVLAEYVFFSKALEYFDKRVLKILDTHDVFGDRHKMYLRQGLQPQWYSTSPREESRGMNRADIVFAIQDQERQALSSRTIKPVVTVGHIVTLSAPTAIPDASNILYVGSKNKINVESVQRFIRQIFPTIRERVPSAVLLVAGGVCDRLGEYDAVVKCGRVERLEQVYATARVVVNPMAFGTGLKVKNLEALGYSKPLVTTAAGADGVEDGIGKAFLVANEPADFADAVVKMLSDRESNAALCRAAYRYASAWNKKVFTTLNAAVTQEIGR